MNVNFEIDIRGGNCQRFVTSLVVLLRPTESDYVKVLWNGTYGLSSLSEKTIESVTICRCQSKGSTFSSVI